MPTTTIYPLSLHDALPISNAAGTYLYGSGGDGGRQQAMGLYGALIVRPSTAGRAYESAATAYDVEAPLVLSAVDPAFNNASDPDRKSTRLNSSHLGISYADHHDLPPFPTRRSSDLQRGGDLSLRQRR